MRVRPDFARERELWGRGVTAVAGVDEVGVGALAGPVIAAAVIFAPGAVIKGLADSKLLSAKRRQALFAVIGEFAVAIGVGRTEVEEVDRINVYWAAMEARRRAVEALRATPGHVLVDGKRRIVGCRFAQTPVVDGDALCSSIAAASIVAKVTRSWESMRSSTPDTASNATKVTRPRATSMRSDGSVRYRSIAVHSRPCG